jgi:hypothetical protein
LIAGLNIFLTIMEFWREPPTEPAPESYPAAKKH